MMNSVYYMPVRTVCGNAAIVNNAALLSQLGKHCLILTGSSGARLSGALDDAKTALGSVGVAYDVFDGIGANPLLSDCHRAGAAARNCHADFIFGIGGGSVLDAAKAVAIYAANADLSPVDIYKRSYSSAPLKVALAGTTAGTGSEVTGVSVLTNDLTGIKKSISGADCYAAVSFCDSRYTDALPYRTTVSTALDALAHAVEGFFTQKCTGILVSFAEKAIGDITRCLSDINRTGALPDCTAREKLYYGSLLAGLVINTCGTAFPHPLGYVLTENYGIPHGYACAAFMPTFLERSSRFAPKKSKLLEQFAGMSLSKLGALAAGLTDISSVSFTPEQAILYAERWANALPKNFAASPGGLSQEEAAGILAAVGSGS